MAEGMCVCGHAESEHENTGMPKSAAVCFHDDDPDDDASPVCPCMEYRPAEAAKAAGQE
jgi:hypothetical protein